jgi:predicted DNA-binding ribbon-helix-helix protein
MKSSIVKRSIVLAGHKTSVSLEEPFYRALKDIAASRRVRLSDLIARPLVGDTDVRAQPLSGGHGIT